MNAGATWTYDTTKKHAVKTAGAGLSYNYDLNGNMTSRNGSTIGWTAYNYPSSLAAGSESTSFSYTPDRRYYKQVYTGPGGTETTHYIGGILEKVALPGGITDWRHYVYAEGQAVAIVSRKSSGTNSVSYPLEDHQGSASVLTNASGGSIVKESFTAFGAPRNGATWSGAVPSGDKTLIAGISRRGYTFHSMLGDMGLIHMNGRVQDAVTGRFLSPDPYVTQPGNTQSFNRYAYVNNNPLSYIDPSGFDLACMNFVQFYYAIRPPPNAPINSIGNVQGQLPEIAVNAAQTPSVRWLSTCTYTPPGAPGYRPGAPGAQPVDPPKDPPTKPEDAESPGNPCNAASSDGTQIVVAYTHANSTTRVPFATHAFVIAFQGGSAYATRGGPGSGPGGGDQRARQIVGVSRPYPSAGFPDKPGDVIDYQVMGFVSLSLDEVASRMNDFAQVTTANDLQYSGSLNSNSYAFAFVESLGLGRGDPAQWAPGSANGVPSPRLQCAIGP